MPRRTSLLATTVLFLASCTTSSQADTIALTSELNEVSTATNAAVDGLFSTVNQEYDDANQLYQRMVDLRLPTTFAIAIDKAQRITAPPGTDTELARYEDFLADLLFASEDLDLAIATEDPVAAAIAVVRIEVASGSLAVALSTGSCISLTPTIGRDLCDAGRFSGYEDSLSFELRRFVASFRPALRIPPAFGPSVGSRVLAALRQDGATGLEATAERIAALTPSAPYQPIHRIVLDYFEGLSQTWSEVVPTPTTPDPDRYDTVVALLDSVRAETHRRLLEAYSGVLAEVPDSQIAWAVDIWFGQPPSMPPAP